MTIKTPYRVDSRHRLFYCRPLVVCDGTRVQLTKNKIISPIRFQYVVDRSPLMEHWRTAAFTEQFLKCFPCFFIAKNYFRAVVDVDLCWGCFLLVNIRSSCFAGVFVYALAFALFFLSAGISRSSNQSAWTTTQPS